MSIKSVLSNLLICPTSSAWGCSLRENSLLTFPRKTPSSPLKLEVLRTGGSLQIQSWRDCQLLCLQSRYKHARDKHTGCSLLMPTEHAQTTKNGEVVAGWKPPLLWFGSFRRSSTGRRGESGALQQTDLRVDTRTPRTVDSATPAQMDIYFTLFSLFFFTKPGNPLSEISPDPSKCHFPVAHEHFYAQSVFSWNSRVFWLRLSLSAIHRVYF